MNLGVTEPRQSSEQGVAPGGALPRVPRISLVIPAHNEERLLPRLLDSVEIARQRFHAGADRVEVIVADNASTDATAAVARARGCAVVRVEPRIIAAVRNGGARAARGEILAFMDADGGVGCSALLGSQFQEAPKVRVRELRRSQPAILLLNRHGRDRRTHLVANGPHHVDGIERLD